jgi:hypothetical protein
MTRLKVLNPQSWTNINGEGLRVLVADKDLRCRSQHIAFASGGALFWTEAECEFSEILTLQSSDLSPDLHLFVFLPPSNRNVDFPPSCARCQRKGETLEIELLVLRANVDKKRSAVLRALGKIARERAKTLGHRAVKINAACPPSRTKERYLSVTFCPPARQSLPDAIEAACGDLNELWQTATSMIAASPSSSSSSRQPSSYNVALSFAGEDREYAEQLATELQSVGLTVFYDRFEQSTMWGRNLYDHLADVYGHRCDFCVMIVSKYYLAKQWPNHERQNAQARALQENREYILPIRLDSTQIPALPPTVSYVDAQQVSVKAIASMLCQKVQWLEKELTGR